MNSSIETLAKVQDKALDAVLGAKDPLAQALGTVANYVTTQVPQLPTIPNGDDLPRVREVVNDGYESAKQFLDARYDSARTFVDEQYESAKKAIDERYEQAKAQADARYADAKELVETQFAFLKRSVDVAKDVADAVIDALQPLEDELTGRVRAVPDAEAA